MELALPHVVVRICGPGVGPDLVAALGCHPVEVSEARDASEARRVAQNRPAVLVVLTDPAAAAAVIAETRDEFGAVPLLLVAAGGDGATSRGAAAQVDSIRADLPLDDLCWHVLEAISRAARRPGIDERPLGPEGLEIDVRGCLVSGHDVHDGLLFDGRRMHAGDSILPLVDSRDRATFTAALAAALGGETRFCMLRVLDERGGRHTAAVGLRGGGGRVAALVQPLPGGGAIGGRRVDDRDPITGLLTRWAVSRALQPSGAGDPQAADGFVVMLRLDDCAAIASQIGHRQIDALLVRVAAALVRVFPWPALGSRLMGDTFLAFLPAATAAAVTRGAEELIATVHGIDVPGFAPGFALRASVGIARVAVGDHDLAIRQAEAAAAEAQAAGGNRAITAGSAAFTPRQIEELTTDLEIGSWEVWLQPVRAADGGRPAFHEALARFDSGLRRVVSRADFFVAGRAAGLLARFDRMMLLRVLELLATHPEVRLSVNVSHETFAADDFPGAWLEAVRAVPTAAARLILEIAPRCLVAPPDDIGSRLASLADAGVAVAIDDFGSGICRLRALTQFPLAIVKLDELVTGYVDDDPLQRQFVRAVVSLCRARGIVTVAEYTRSPAQLARLVADGVDLFQGELTGMPRPHAEVLPVPAAAVRG